MIRLSATLIKDFISCPRKVHYRITQPEQALPTKEMIQGTIVHYILENHWNDYNRAVQAISEQIRKHNLKVGYEKIYRCVENFFSAYHCLCDAEDKIEELFKIDYRDNVTIVGRMDRVSSQGYVIDWKTGERPPEDIDRDIQFILYYMAYEKLYGKPPNNIFYVSLATKKLYDFHPDPVILNDFQENILPYVIRQLESKEYPRTGFYSYKTCLYCSYSNTCHSELGIE